MVKVDIFSSKGGDILVIDTEQVLTGTLFDFLVEYLIMHACKDIQYNWFWDCKEENVQSCLQHRGIAIQLFGRVCKKAAAKAHTKRVIEVALQEALG